MPGTKQLKIQWLGPEQSFCLYKTYPSVPCTRKASSRSPLPACHQDPPHQVLTDTLLYAHQSVQACHQVLTV